MFVHFTYTVPHGPLLGQRETTSALYWLYEVRLRDYSPRSAA